ncbi:LZIC protein [Salpingoeca rosetta]|uniref:LZIC protein n=1 Tax=Salpingoeca rosetta (strain ATCC 50818 / BSB-021) TaxID=946362 RepID=F2U8Y3_SALR5|nr:LZIC protein [Salpingoeca rosetta]EGD73186.1 LZIC protein [Salpingoeca rosetta]|eukprot:XP_004994217.1 LZIC protein [Salpingoeca rosetta]
MASRGDKETDALKKNLEEQLDRLMVQLRDLEELREDLDDDEYEETKQDTIEQLKEFQESLSKLTEGNMSLVDNIGAMQLAIQAAVSEAFKTPEVIRLFAKREPGQLRERIAELDKQVSIGGISKESAIEQKVEILTALRQLGEQISPEEVQFLTQHSTAALDEFQRVSGELNANVLAKAGSQVQSASS